jgi:diguanylate cyclase (GGDEF)-like protein
MVRYSRLEQLEAAVAAALEPAARVGALNALATELARTGYARRGLTLAGEARSAAEAAGDPALVAASLHTLARCQFNLADFVAALELLLQAARIYQAHGDLAGATTAFAGVGLCQHRLGAQEDAVASLLSALESAREQNFAALETNIHNSLGSALLASGRADDAARHLATGVELAVAQGNRSLLTKLVHNQALVAQRRGDEAPDRETAQREYEAGLDSSRQALALARELGNRYDEAHSLGQSGTMLRLVGRTEEADQALTATLALGRELDEKRVQAEALLELGRLHLGRDGSEARRFLHEAIAVAVSCDARTLLADACADLSAQYERDGDAGPALSLYKRFHEVREAEFATTRQHAARAAQLWIDFQQATRQATQYREQVKVLAEDKEALAKRAEALTVASQQDPLTGLFNRRGLDTQVADLAAASDATGVPLTIALVDIDGFKAINDSFSHAVGDAVLKRVAGIIRVHCRAHDLPVRYGGDEFLVVLEGADMEDSARVLRRLKGAVDACPWSDEAPGLVVTLSIGAATHRIGAAIAATIAEADRALYSAKAGGRDRIVLAPAPGA